ncbi:hypothetical protein CC78DRAFT_584966 [Lojkania enalia]|uniref:Uncharacterized protein n=1 Tax=Lojkania enalia TaxID=147567 RepID=A0A9P4N0A6_9PLEO|nr:hypothetical protein CC78DRAFT_584966 [Didymosphaeria enalia]
MGEVWQAPKLLAFFGIGTRSALAADADKPQAQQGRHDLRGKQEQGQGRHEEERAERAAGGRKRQHWATRIQHERPTRAAPAVRTTHINSVPPSKDCRSTLYVLGPTPKAEHIETLLEQRENALRLASARRAPQPPEPCLVSAHQPPPTPSIDSRFLIESPCE